MEQQLLMKKSFMSRNSCLRLECNKATKSVYLHIGKRQQDSKFKWICTKLNDSEAADLILVARGKLDQVSFFHKFENKGKNIDTVKRTWINRDENNLLWIRIEEFRKSLSKPEALILEILLQAAIVAYNEV